VTRVLYAVMPLVAGGLLAAQAPINARLRVVLDSPLGSAFISFAVGLVILFVVLAAVGDVPKLSALGGGPWWAYLGGLLGAVFVVVGILATPKVGVTLTFVAVILGQIVVASLIDKFGWLGVDAIPLSWERVTAVGLMAVALLLLVRS
jgi:bacterial/archaeal transporter family-2 protein